MIKKIHSFTRHFFYLRILVAGGLISAGAALAVFAASPVGDGDVSKANSANKAANGVYIVRMRATPAASYTGDVAGYPATKAAPGQKIDPLNSDVVRYVGYLKSKHDEALQKVGGATKVSDYAFSYDGFAAKLTASQAAAMAKQADVVSVVPDQLVTQDTTSTPHFLGLDVAGGLWSQLGGPTGGKNLNGAGEGMIIGVIDSGIWPQSKSFTDRDTNGKLVYTQIAGFHGKCDSLETVPDGSWDANLCNKKLVAAQHFNAAWGGDAALHALRPWEFLSPRDYNGHGTHTSSTAGGNNGVQPTGPAAGFAPISGMAPRARVAMYKALWSTQDASTASGFTSDLVAAIDQAVADGVDAINYSISGTLTNFLDPVEVAYFFAADAGVFVSESAGNSGPTASTVAHPSPWTTTVAAGTHNRSGVGSVTLGNGATYSGASIAAAVGPAPFIRSTDAGLAGANATAVRLCFTQEDNNAIFAMNSPVLDPAKITGKIVLCDRGTSARVNKSLAVSRAGGVGMVLANASPNSLNADFHFVPTVHVQNTDRAALIAYSATMSPSPTAKINQSTITFVTPAPFTASFSSRGPLIAGAGNLLKPDVIAPGQDILASVAPPGNNGFDFNLYSGTSMSAPHVAGVGTLLKQLHPTWSPMMVKSALMTSGSDVLDGSNTDPAVIFSQGAGHIRPNSAADPGLVYNSNINDWLAFLCGTTNGVSAATCGALAGAGYSFDPSNFNAPSIAIGALPGIQTVTRKVTNVGSAAATYTASSTGLSGITVAISPSSLSLNPGETKSYTVTFTRTTAAIGSYVGGQLTWTDGTHNVRIPMVIRPVALAAPAQVSGTGGAINYGIKFGYTGPFSATARGLVPATTFAGTVFQDPGQSFSPGGSGTTSFDVAVPAGTTYARFSTFNEFIDGPDDIDLYVDRCPCAPGGTRVGASTGGTAAEEVNLVNPTAATYRVWIHGFAVNPSPANFTLFTWVLGSADAGNMAVTAPSSATTGASGNINLVFSSLSAATKYLGSVAYSGDPGLPNPTIVRVDTP